MGVCVYIYIYSFIICLCVMVNDHLESLISRNIPVSDPFHPPVSQIPTPQRRTLARPPWLQGWNLMGKPMGRLMWSLVMAGHGVMASPPCLDSTCFFPSLDMTISLHEQLRYHPMKGGPSWNRASNGNFQMPPTQKTKKLF